MKKLKVFIISQEEPFYLPKVIRFLLENKSDHFEIIGATRLKPHRKNKTMKDWFLERTSVYSYGELFITFCFFIYAKIWSKVKAKFTGRNYFSVGHTYKEHGIKKIHTEDINSKEYLNQLKGLDIDVILSISPPQLFKKELLSLPNLYCLNAHGTLLPRHRGVFGSWWMLYENDKEIGTTIHTMVEKLDAGEILWQKAIPTPENATQYSIAYHTKKIMAQGLIELLNEISKGTESPITPKYTQSYHRAPTKEEGKDFHKKGKKIITFANSKLTLSKRFPKNNIE